MKRTFSLVRNVFFPAPRVSLVETPPFGQVEVISTFTMTTPGIILAVLTLGLIRLGAHRGRVHGEGVVSGRMYMLEQHEQRYPGTLPDPASARRAAMLAGYAIKAELGPIWYRDEYHQKVLASAEQFAASVERERSSLVGTN